LKTSPTSVQNAVLGAQRPRVSHIPEYVESSGDEAIELAALAGLELDDWQQYVLRHSPGERADGQWAAPTVGLVVGRQNGKGSILEARELAGLFLLGERLIIHTAHRQKIATNHFRRVRDLIKAVPEFHERVAKYSEGKGSEAIELKDGRRIEFATRMSGNARGLTADLIVYDEAMFLTESDRSAIAPTMAARSMAGNVQIWYVGSAVDEEDPAQDGVPFAQVRQSGINGLAGVAYFEWSAAGDDPDKVTEEMRRDPQAWAQANPGLGIRISAEWIETERTVEMGPRGFAVERLSIGAWPDPSLGAGRVISGEMWAAVVCEDKTHRIVGERTFALDLNPSRTWGAIDVAGPHAGKRWHVAVVEHKRSTGWIVPKCEALQEEYPESSFAYDTGGPVAKSEIPAELRDAGVRVIELDTTDYAQACAGFYDAVDKGTLRYPAGEGALTDAVADARRQDMGDGWKWSRRNSTSADITPLVAGSIALWAAKQVGGYTNVIFLDEEPDSDAAEIGTTPVPMQVLEPEDYTDCFGCRTGYCEVHGIGV
jgi:hypothetical protein